MKLSRNVLVGSLATAGMVLGAIAPALTAQAATTSATVDSDGNVKGTTLTDKTYSSDPTDSLPDGGLAIAYDDGNGNAGSASAESNANVKVVSGLLVLNAVPDFGFGSAAEGSTVGLVNNKHDLAGTDSQDNDSVRITESRTGQPGFSLAAQITNFKTTGDTTGRGFTLNLKPTELTDGNGTSASTLKTSDVKLSGADAAATDLINLDKNEYNAGSINARFAPSDKNAFLALTDKGSAVKTGDPKNPTVTSYNANITWTLTAKATVTGA